MTPLSRLRELAARSTQIKELGLLTKNEPTYDKDGHFTGVENHYNGPGIAEAAGGAAVLGAGLGAGHVGVMKKYGTETLRREKGRFISPREVKVPVGQAYKKAGSDVLAKIRSLAGKRFSSEDRLKELARGDYAIPAMKAILKASKEAPLHLNGVEGAAVPALRGNVHQVRRALNKFWGENSTAKEAALHTKGVRGWAAGEIRGERSLPKDLRAWSPKPDYKVKGKLLSAKDRLKELAGGYAMKDGESKTIYKEPGVKGHLKRHAGLYISAPLALPSLGIAPLIGAGVDQMRAGGNILKTHIDSVNPLVPKLPKHAKARASHQIYDGGDGTMAYIPLSAKDRLKELADKSVALKAFDQKLDENGHPILDAAAGAGLGVGAALGHGAVMRKYGSGKVGLNSIKQAYGAAANDFKGGFSKGFNPPSTSAGAGSVATAATNSPLSADGAKLGGAAKAGEEASVLTRAGSKAGRLGAVIRGFLSRMR
jgi:hypothetical protein